MRALTGRQKAAVLLAQIDSAVAVRLLSHLDEKEVVLLAEEVAALPLLERDDVGAVLQEFSLHGRVLAEARQGGHEAARRLLAERLGASAADEIITRLLSANTPRPLDSLRAVEPAQLAEFLAGEHPQTIAVVLIHLPAELSARVLGEMDPALRPDVAERIAVMGRVAPEVVSELAAVLERKLATTLGGEQSDVGGVPALVKILNSSERSAERQMLSQLESHDPELAEEVRRQLFVFDDIVRLDDRAMQIVLRSVNTKELALALKGSTPEIREKFLRNISERARADVEEELELLGPTRLSKVEGAQAAIMRRIRELDAEGTIVLARGQDELLV